MELDDSQQLFTGAQPPDRAAAARAALATTADVAPDLTVQVEHRNCGDATCRRPDGHVVAAVTWIDNATQFEPKYKAAFADGGHPICGQTMRRAARTIDELLRERLAANGKGFEGE